MARVAETLIAMGRGAVRAAAQGPLGSRSLSNAARRRAQRHRDRWRAAALCRTTSSIRVALVGTVRPQAASFSSSQGDC